MHLRGPYDEISSWKYALIFVHFDSRCWAILCPTYCPCDAYCFYINLKYEKGSSGGGRSTILKHQSGPDTPPIFGTPSRDKGDDDFDLSFRSPLYDFEQRKNLSYDRFCNHFTFRESCFVVKQIAIFVTRGESKLFSGLFGYRTKFTAA